MRLSQHIAALILASAVGLCLTAAPAAAQQHIVDRPALQAAVTDKVNTDAANRSAVLSPRVRGSRWVQLAAQF